MDADGREAFNVPVQCCDLSADCRPVTFKVDIEKCIRVELRNLILLVKSGKEYAS
jgi:hypothetical protein